MAQYCHECSLAIIGKDQFDFANLEDGTTVVCACCGPIVVDHHGVKMARSVAQGIPYSLDTCDCLTKAMQVQPENVLDPETEGMDASVLKARPPRRPYWTQIVA